MCSFFFVLFLFFFFLVRFGSVKFFLNQSIKSVVQVQLCALSGIWLLLIILLSVLQMIVCCVLRGVDGCGAKLVMRSAKF
jgi:hypothetical protein